MLETDELIDDLLEVNEELDLEILDEVKDDLPDEKLEWEPPLENPPLAKTLRDKNKEKMRNRYFIKPSLGYQSSLAPPPEKLPPSPDQSEISNPGDG